MADPYLDIDALSSNPHAQVLVRHSSDVHGYEGNSRTWKSWMQDDFQVGVSADFSAPFEDFLESTSTFIGKAQVATEGGLSSAFESLTGKSIESARTKQALTYTYNNSDRPTFNLTMVFLAVGMESRPQHEAVSLAKLQLPRIGSGGDNVTLLAPGGYRAGGKVDGNGGNEPRGTFQLEIGNWFWARGLVLRDAQMTLAQQRMANGQPLYAEVAVTLEPYRMISEDEFENYFAIRALSEINIFEQG